jgi:hypothetical protein
MFELVRRTSELLDNNHKVGDSVFVKLDGNVYAYYDNDPPYYNGSIGPQGGFDFDYFGYGLTESGTVPNGTLEHPW